MLNQERPLPPDILAAIESPPTARPWPPDPEMGLAMKIKARKEIDEGLYKTREDIDARTRMYAEWFNSMEGVLRPETIENWMRYELMFAASAIKYLRELKEAENCNK